jgi:hypothetical protein
MRRTDHTPIAGVQPIIDLSGLTPGLVHRFTGIEGQTGAVLIAPEKDLTWQLRHGEILHP